MLDIKEIQARSQIEKNKKEVEELAKIETAIKMAAADGLFEIKRDSLSKNNQDALKEMGFTVSFLSFPLSDTPAYWTISWHIKK